MGFTLSFGNPDSGLGGRSILAWLSVPEAILPKRP
jgi:hypothetical protein